MYRQIKKVRNKVFSTDGGVIWSSKSPREAEKQKSHSFYACCTTEGIKTYKCFTCPASSFALVFGER